MTDAVSTSAMSDDHRRSQTTAMERDKCTHSHHPTTDDDDHLRPRAVAVEAPSSKRWDGERRGCTLYPSPLVLCDFDVLFDAHCIPYPAHRTSCSVPPTSAHTTHGRDTEAEAMHAHQRNTPGRYSIEPDMDMPRDVRPHGVRPVPRSLEYTAPRMTSWSPHDACKISPRERENGREEEWRSGCNVERHHPVVLSSASGAGDVGENTQGRRNLDSKVTRTISPQPLTKLALSTGLTLPALPPLNEAKVSQDPPAMRQWSIHFTRARFAATRPSFYVHDADRVSSMQPNPSAASRIPATFLSPTPWLESPPPPSIPWQITSRRQCRSAECPRLPSDAHIPSILQGDLLRARPSL
ncbi:hypothetical protein B0H19DRAFT_1276375 [Mycena capillaripes]|nr:hypothetical protein B0H19DRAFT_1276375 [Mycena capillaripes]